MHRVSINYHPPLAITILACIRRCHLCIRRCRLCMVRCHLMAASVGTHERFREGCDVVGTGFPGRFSFGLSQALCCQAKESLDNSCPGSIIRLMIRPGFFRYGQMYDPHTFEPKRSIGRLIARVRIELMDALDRELAPSP